MSAPKYSLALVTGASLGIGRGVALRLAREGVKVILVARSRDKLEILAKEIRSGGGEAEPEECDMGCRESVVTMAQRVITKYGVPDLIVNNAGCYYIQQFCDKGYDSWERMISLNIMGYLVLIGEFINPMKERGSGVIVNITSDSEREAFPGLMVYTGTKFFWAGATSSLRQEIKGTGVKVINILPGFVDTEGLREVFTDEYSAGVMKEYGYGDIDSIRNHSDKMLSPEDVAQTVWESVNKPSNVYIEDVMIKDEFQNMKI